jgi:hypothetical protein
MASGAAQPVHHPYWDMHAGKTRCRDCDFESGPDAYAAIQGHCADTGAMSGGERPPAHRPQFKATSGRGGIVRCRGCGFAVHVWDTDPENALKSHLRDTGDPIRCEICRLPDECFTPGFARNVEGITQWPRFAVGELWAGEHWHEIACEEHLAEMEATYAAETRRWNLPNSP